MSLDSKFNPLNLKWLKMYYLLLGD
jgi:hypothetical protein